MADSFVHLHQHTSYSMLDGASRIVDVVAAAVNDGQPALGITDHGNMYGVLDFYRECRDHGIVPVVGMEAYAAAESRHERPPRRGTRSGEDGDGGTKVNFHLTLLAENNTGYRNLIKLSSRAFLEGYYYKPRVDWDLLAEHADGLIATTGCLGGHVAQALLAGDEPGARALAGRLQDIFGRDNLFIELQDHGLADQHRILDGLLAIAVDLRAPLLATNDSHYVHRDDHLAHDALLCVQTGTRLDDPNRFRFDGHEHYLKTAAEMRALFAELPEACDNTLWVAERSQVDVDFGTYKLPSFPIPAGFDDDTAYLTHLSFAGARNRWGDPLPTDVADRVAYELKVIADMGFASYFLIVWDLIRHARDHGIRVGPGRGSAAGSAVAYCLRITELDPLRHGLVFERFLNPSRVSMPDIDMDFDSRAREEMIRYAAQKYGRDHVAQIITFSSIKARAAVRDATRVLGKPYAVGDRISKALPPLLMGRDTPLRACLEKDVRYEDGYAMASQLRTLYDTDPEVKAVVDVARGLEGLHRQDGIHAAAVVIAPAPITEFCPVQRKPEAGQDPDAAPVVTQYEMHGVEALGLLKMDFLGLRNLDVITDTVAMIRIQQPGFDIDTIALDDPATFALLRRGTTVGVFQLESAPMRKLLRQLAPTDIDDVAAVLALYRPGPMAANMHVEYAERKNGRAPLTYPDPALEAVLARTYGLMVYQEQIMGVAQTVAGYTLAEADLLRKATGKKNRDLMAAERAKFVAGAAANGFGERFGNEMFDLIEPAADYSFNASHAYGYGLISYQTAYLKANYPAEYVAALLTSVQGNHERAAVYLAEARALGLTVHPPDVNRSGGDATGRDGQVVLGLGAVRNIGAELAERIVVGRDDGPYRSLTDFCRRVTANKRAIDSLIKAGGFDWTGVSRAAMAAAAPVIVDQATKRRRSNQNGLISLFGDSDAADIADPAMTLPEWGSRERLRCERQMLGLYVSDHPLAGHETRLRAAAPVGIAELLDAADPDATVRVGGVITTVETRRTKRGDLMADLTLDGLDGSLAVVAFPKTWAAYETVLTADAIVTIDGRFDRGDDDTKFVALSAAPIDLGDGAVAGPAEPLGQPRPGAVTIRVEHHWCTPEHIAALHDIITAHGGSTGVRLVIDGAATRHLIDLGEKHLVAPDSQFRAALQALHGPELMAADGTVT